MKIRLDQLLVERGLASSRNLAQAMIMAGEVSLRGQSSQKAGQMVPADAELEVKDRPRYVSRGGDKLASVAEELGLDFKAKTVLDVGASTGGFTDFALQHGAAKVYAVDVGTGQLDFKLRQDPRVVVLERTDVRRLARSHLVQGDSLQGLPDIILIDVSFISLKKVLPSVVRLLDSGGLVAALAKPQFEAGKAVADRFRGVIKDESVRQEILIRLRAWLQENFIVENEADSKLPGAEGNVERFFLLRPKR